MTPQLRRETADRWLACAKKVAIVSQDGTALAIVDRLKKDSTLARWSFIPATFKEEFNGITFRGDLLMSEFCTGSLLLHEGHHACRIPGQKINRLDAMFRAHIELEAFLLQERLAILTGGERYVAFRAFLIGNIAEYLRLSGQSLLSGVSVSDPVICEINEKIEEYLLPVWGNAYGERDRFSRVADMMLYARFEMVRQQYPANKQHDAMKKIVAIMYNLEEEVKQMQLAV